MPAIAEIFDNKESFFDRIAKTAFLAKRCIEREEPSRLSTWSMSKVIYSRYRLRLQPFLEFNRCTVVTVTSSASWRLPLHSKEQRSVKARESRATKSTYRRCESTMLWCCNICHLHNRPNYFHELLCEQHLPFWRKAHSGTWILFTSVHWGARTKKKLVSLALKTMCEQWEITELESQDLIKFLRQRLMPPSLKSIVFVAYAVPGVPII